MTRALVLAAGCALAACAGVREPARWADEVAPLTDCGRRNR
jgi:hypothetical protein